MNNPAPEIRQILLDSAEASQRQRRLGMLIKRLRISRELLQKDLARSLGITASFLSDVEQGNRTLGPEKLIKLLELL